MEDNKRKGPGLFYGVMGVATLVVAIIGATFAYFSASTPDNAEITGTTADVKGLTLDVVPLVEPEELLVPQLASTITDALVGHENNKCVDANGNGVCRVYKIIVTNPGSAAIHSKGTMTLTAVEDETSAFTNLKWALITKGVSGDDADTVAFTSELAVGSTNGMEESTIATPLLEAAPKEVEGDEEPVETNNSAEYYLVVWLNETTSPDQQEEDHGTFTGTISWAGIDGDIKVTSTFTVKTPADPTPETGE